MSNTFMTDDDARIRTAKKLGFDRPSGLDLVSRSNYASDDAYIDAAVKAQISREDPRYKELYRKFDEEYRDRQEAEARKDVEKEHAKIRSNVQLWDLDIRNIDKEAEDLARRDLVAGRISASLLGETIEKYAKELTEQRKNDKANAQHMNSIFRNMFRG